MPSRRSNRSELDDLSATQRTAVNEGAHALGGLTGRASFHAWMQVARGIVPLCALADKPGRSRSARRSLFKEAGYGSLSQPNISRLLHMGRLASQIEIWHMGLKPRQRDTWNSPATICKRCPEVRKAIEEANKNRPPRVPRPRPVVDPADELERTVNRLYDLLDAVKDIDLRREQIERLTTLLSELSGREEPKSATKARKAKPTEEEMEAEPAKAKPPSRKPSRAQAEQIKKPTKKRATSKGDAAADQQAVATKAKRKAVKAAPPQPEQAKGGALKWKGTLGALGTVTAAVGGGEEYAIRHGVVFNVIGGGGKRDNFSVYFGRADVPLEDRRESMIGEAAMFDKAKDIAERHAAAKK